MSAFMLFRIAGNNKLFADIINGSFENCFENRNFNVRVSWPTSSQSDYRYRKLRFPVFKTAIWRESGKFLNFFSLNSKKSIKDGELFTLSEEKLYYVQSFPCDRHCSRNCGFQNRNFLSALFKQHVLLQRNKHINNCGFENGFQNRTQFLVSLFQTRRKI